MITIKLKENNKTIRARVNNSLSTLLNNTIRRKQGMIFREIRELIPDWVESQPEMIDLAMNIGPGSLAGQFGLMAGSGPEIVKIISKTVQNSISLNISNISKKDLSGGIEINFMSATFEELLTLPEGHVFYDDGYLHWLDWLLTQGFKVIVVGYSFRFLDGGRSGGGIMTKGGLWRVPPQFAGTVEDNFITRALTSPTNQLQIQQILQRHIK
jgi:hypothetical protein